MKSDSQLQHDVLQELEWRPSIDASQIGVLAKNGVVTLTGFVPQYVDKIEAERVTKSVAGVKAVADEIDLRMTPLQARSMRLTHPSASDVAWLQDKLNRECERLGTRVNRTENDLFLLHWNIKPESTAVT